MADKGFNKWEEVIFIIILLVGLVAPFLIFQLWWWAVTMGTIALIVALSEIISKLVTGKTISQQFWAWSITVGNRWKAWLLLGSLQVAWLALLWHLASKLLK